MPSDDWYLTDDIDHFLSRAGDFLRSRPVLHNTPLTTLERLRTGTYVGGTEGCLYGWLETGGEVRSFFYRTPGGRVTLAALDSGRADGLAARLSRLGHSFSGVIADHDTATAFAEAWRRHTGAAAVRDWRGRLHRLDALTPPQPVPVGRDRPAGEQDHEHVMNWCREFAADVGEPVTLDAATWPGTRFAEKRYTLWETPDGTPVSMAGANPLIAGQVRVDPVFTPAHLRGHGYAAAVTVAVSRAALAAGAREVVLFTDPANRTSNALYRRIGYVPVAEFTGYGFAAPRH
jgi:hypothetical protein